MRLVLNENEIERAIRRYVESKSAPPEGSEWAVTIMWRGKPLRAEVELRKVIPTLTEKASRQ